MKTHGRIVGAGYSGDHLTVHVRDDSGELRELELSPTAERDMLREFGGTEQALGECACVIADDDERHCRRILAATY